jgi:hypothetical protein
MKQVLEKQEGRQQHETTYICPYPYLLLYDTNSVCQSMAEVSIAKRRKPGPHELRPTETSGGGEGKAKPHAVWIVP